MVEVELKGWGNSVGIVLPAEKLKELHLRKGDKLEIDIVKKQAVDGFGIAKGSQSFREEAEEHAELWEKK